MKTTPTIQDGRTTQHTPGPWDDASKYPNIPSVRIFAKCQCIATVGYPGDDRDEINANARLIAAAPELLEACKNLLVKHEHPAEDVFAEEVARAAISKAEGRDSTQMSRS